MVDRGKDLAELLLRRFGVRVGSCTGDYAARCLNDAPAGESEISVLGGDARTGVPVRRTIPHAQLRLASDTTTTTTTYLA